MRVLIVEDSPRLQRTVGAALRKSGYAVDVAADGEEGLWMAESHDYDVIILDIMLPKRDGLAVLGDLRQHGKATHVLLLTARDTVPDRVRGLRAGADDYLVKPFALDELLARVESLCRRAYGHKQTVIAIGDLAIDTVGRRVRRAGREIDLSAREYLLLEYLARRRGQVVSRAEVEEHIYDEQVDPMSNVVDSAICCLRKKLAMPGEPPLIHTRRGLGYALEEASAATATP
ncbi:MAG TPA: response regulator transcription factor [Opitutales bacterium]|nr:response regulator transcription factor [Opitutales bacterium]